MKLGDEDVSLVQLFDWIRSRPDIEPYAWHTANERQTTPQAGRILKRKGVRAGVSDVAVMIARGGYHGMFIELKSKNGKLSHSQEKFLEDMMRQNYYTKVCWSFEEAKEAIIDYLQISSS